MTKCYDCSKFIESEDIEALGCEDLAEGQYLDVLEVHSSEKCEGFESKELLDRDIVDSWVVEDGLIVYCADRTMWGLDAEGPKFRWYPLPPIPEPEDEDEEQCCEDCTCEGEEDVKS